MLFKQMQRAENTFRLRFRGRSTCQRHGTLKKPTGSQDIATISRTLHAPASRRAENNKSVAPYAQNLKDTPHASVTTRQKHPETARRLPLTSRISKTLHASASRRAENDEVVATCAQNFEDAPHASVTTRRKQREGRHLRPEFE